MLNLMKFESIHEDLTEIVKFGIYFLCNSTGRLLSVYTYIHISALSFKKQAQKVHNDDNTFHVTI